MYPKLGCPSLLFSVTRPTLNGHPHRRPLFFGNLEKKVLLCPLSPFVRFISCPLFSFTYEICRGRRGSIWPNFAGRSGQNLAIEKCAARFGQILPGSLRAKFGQILPRISHRIRRAANLAFARRQNLAKSSRAFLEARNYLNYFNY